MIMSNWSATNTSKQAKRFIEPSEKSTRNLLKINKINLRIITGLLTGHCPSRYHLAKIGRLEDSKCRFCQFENETSEHLLCNCRALMQSRFCIFGKGLMQPNDIWRASPNRVIDFIKRVEPDWDKCSTQEVPLTLNSVG